AAMEVIDRRLADAGAVTRTGTLATRTMTRPADESRAVPRVVESKAVQPHFPLSGSTVLGGGQAYAHTPVEQHGPPVCPALRRRGRTDRTRIKSGAISIAPKII